MNYCKNCKVQILDETEVCPLCKNVIKIENLEWDSVESDPFPDLLAKQKILDFLLRLYAFLAVAATVICGFLNFQINRDFPWSIIVAASLLYGLWIFSLLIRETGYIHRIFAIMIGAVALVVLIDVVTGARGWSWNYALPAGMLLIDVIFVSLIFINRRNWAGYMVVQILMILIAIIPLVLILTGVVNHPLMSELAILSAIILFLATLIIGGREARTELGRRFRI